MKKLLCIYYLLCIATLAYAQDLRFNANGKFKIVQFTDVHYIFNDSRAEVAIERINEVLNAENPTGNCLLEILSTANPQKKECAPYWNRYLNEKSLLL